MTAAVSLMKYRNRGRIPYTKSYIQQSVTNGEALQQSYQKQDSVLQKLYSKANSAVALLRSTKYLRVSV